MDAPKFDNGKPDFSLIPVAPLEELARVYMYGVEKYGVREGWRQGFAWCRIYSAMIRHMQSWLSGETMDPETGLPHAAHAAWGAFTLIEMERTGAGTDDRYKVAS